MSEPAIVAAGEAEALPLARDGAGAAPGPWSWQAIAAAGGGLGHVYIVDRAGRKIGVAWGPAEERRRTAALFRSALSAARALRIAKAQLVASAPSRFDPAYRAAIDAIDAALSETEDLP